MASVETFTEVRDRAPAPTRRAVVALVALSLATFLYLTAELLPIGLLTTIAADLGRSRSEIGMLVTGYAVVVIIASFPLTRATQRVPRRYLLVAVLGVLVIGTLLTAVTVNYLMLLVSRLLVGLSQAIFWSVVSPAAAELFPARIRGRVLARLAIGTSIGPVLGVPAGTWLGQQIGWRSAFLALAGIALVTCIVVLVAVPTATPLAGEAARGPMPDTRRYAVLLVVTALGAGGYLTAYTYITPFLIDVTGFGQAALGPLLFVSGFAGLAGTFVVGRFLDRQPWASLVVPLAALTAALAALYVGGSARPVAVAVLAVTGLAYSALAIAVGNRTLQTAPVSTDLAAAGSSSAFNVGIAAGSFIGGQLVAGAGARSVALVGAVLAAAAFVLMLCESRLPHAPRRAC